MRGLVNIFLDRVVCFGGGFVVAGVLHHAVHGFADGFHGIREPGFFLGLRVFHVLVFGFGRFGLGLRKLGGMRCGFLDRV